MQRLAAVSVLVCGSLAAAGAQPSPEPVLVLHVAPAGHDAGDGTAAAPFATVARARDAIREFRRSHGGRLPGPVTVRLRGGVYRLEQTLVFTPEDSGAPAAPVTYEASPGERPVLSGGRPVRGWTRHDERLWAAHVPWAASSESPPCQLFVNGARRPRARTPNEGAYFYSRRLLLGQGEPPQCLGLVSQPGDLEPWDAAEDALICLFHNWVNSYNRVREADWERRRLTFARPAGIFFLGPSVRYYVENTFAALDHPGEWYLDRRAGVLYYYPLPDEDVTAAEVILPVVRQTLVRFEGDPLAGLYVEHLVFRGLSFQHTDADLSPTYEHSVQGANCQRGALFATGLRDTLIEQCEFTRLGEHAVSLREGCADNTIRQCYIADTGGGGVYLSEAAPRRTDPSGLTLRTTVENNFIHDGGHIFRASCGVFLAGAASHNRILHNEICDLSWVGIHVGWSWTGREPAYTHHNEVGYNHIHHLGNGVLNDLGGIYTLGVSPGTVLHHNHIHDITRFEQGRLGYGGWGIYLDAGSSEIQVEDNVVHDTRDGGLHVHNHSYPYGNRIVNNVFAYGQDAQLIRNADHDPESWHVDLERNIACGAGPAMLGGSNWRPESRFRSDRNVFWCERGSPDFAGMSFGEWQQTGRDAHSIVADPRFADAPGRDFRLRPDSPALALGIRPIDLSETGLQGPPEWRRLPLSVRHRPFEAAAEPPPPAWPMEEGFEDYLVGDRPPGAVPDEGPARAFVTDAEAASGKQCLRFEDGPGATAWKPHWCTWFDAPEGALRVDCSVRNDLASPAVVELEWRDWPPGAGVRYATGPHVRLMPDGAIHVPDAAGGWTPAAAYPLGRWVRVQVEFRHGKDQPRTWSLRLRTEDREIGAWEGLAFRSKEFVRCTWFGVVGAGTASAGFDLDDVRVEPGP